MNVRDLEAFVAVVETGSIVAASAHLHLTQSAVTRRVQGLEQLVGAQLLERSSKPLRPTESGRRMYELGRRVLRSVDDIRSEFAAGVPPAGELRLGVAPFVAEAALKGPLDAVRAAYPALLLQVTSAWSPELVDQVRRSQLDAAAVSLPRDERLPSELSAEKVGEHSIAIVAALNAPFSRRMGLRRLRGTPWVLNQDGCVLRASLRRAHERSGLALEVAVEAMGLDLQLSLVSRGVGLGIVSASDLRFSRWRDKVRVIEVPELKSSIGVLVVHRPPAGRLSAPIARLRDALAAAYARPGGRAR